MTSLAKIWKSFYLRAAMLGVVVCCVLWAALGTIAFAKIVSMLLMPVGLVWILLTVLVVEAIRSGRRRLVVIAALAWCAFTLAGNPNVAGWLAHSREDRYAGIDPLKQGVFDVVIVLGGGANLGATGRDQGNASGDRLILAAQMYHQGVATRIVCTGRRIAEMDTTGVDPARRSATVLQGLGVPLEAIAFAGGRNTFEEMRGLAEELGEPGQRVGLLTSAWHLPRAQRLARKHGFDPEPLPADFITGPPGSSRTFAALLRSLVPSADAFSVTGKISREILAGLLGR